MENIHGCEDSEVLMERLMRVENALFYLKAKSKCFPRWDNSEVERLERLRVELRSRCERLCQQEAAIAG
jgi:hypothetical protein